MSETKRKVYELVVVDRQDDVVVENVFATGENESDAVARAAKKLKSDIADRRFAVVTAEIGDYVSLEPTLIKNVAS